MFVNVKQGYLNFHNPLIDEAYDKYISIQKTEEVKPTLEDFFQFCINDAELVVKELENLTGKEYITIEDYLAATTKVNKLHMKELLKVVQLMVNKQDQLLVKISEFINTSLKIISDEQAMEKAIADEKDLLKKSYFPTVIRIQKTLLGEFRKEVIKAQKNHWKILAPIPGLKYFAFGKRTHNFRKFARTIAATNILVIRLVKLFDKDKIKKEITQAYEEFAKAGILEPKHKFDRYNEYIANAIKV
ncbi:MAG: hypothetical protein JW744_03750 [Candidatus Diapherotrites archaeon]|uniref:Uncharacterized protein n=1 Tax=Candidatus Iainarchaeum sp. TaxID=3101447 RepID=A0A938YXM3_9ARCH|nr:hypothetical protein [Candidatus Diapherotrites archaeon]